MRREGYLDIVKLLSRTISLNRCWYFIALSVIFSGIKGEVWQIRRFSIYRGR